jgi:hypothetical protein
MLEMENCRHHISSVFIIGYLVNGAGQLKWELFCVLADLAEITGQVSEGESYTQGDSDKVFCYLS